MVNRRTVLVGTSAAMAAALAPFPLAWAGDTAATKRKLLFFTKSSGFEHSAIKRKAPDMLSHAEQVVTDLGAKHNFEVTPIVTTTLPYPYEEMKEELGLVQTR